MDGRHRSDNAPLAVPRSAAERRGKRRMFEHRDVRVRPPFDEHRRAVERTRCSFDHRHRRMVFGHFLPKQKVARAVGRRGKRHGRQLSRSKGTGFRVLACGQPRNDECFALASRVKMLERVRTLTRPSGTLSRGERDSERGEIRVRRHEPLRSRVGEVYLDAGMRA